MGWMLLLCYGLLVTQFTGPTMSACNNGYYNIFHHPCMTVLHSYIIYTTSCIEYTTNNYLVSLKPVFQRNFNSTTCML